MEKLIQETSNQCARQLQSLFDLRKEDQEDLRQEIWIHLFQNFKKDSSTSPKEIYISGYRRGLNYLREVLKIKQAEVSLTNKDLPDEAFEQNLIDQIETKHLFHSLPSHLSQLGHLNQNGFTLEEISERWGYTKNTIQRWNKKLKENIQLGDKGQTTTKNTGNSRKKKECQHRGVSCNGGGNPNRSDCDTPSQGDLLSLYN